LETKDNEDITKKEMKDKVEKAGTDDEQKLDMTKYNSDTNATKDGDPDKKGMVKYL
jgi:hypothetical protein